MLQLKKERNAIILAHYYQRDEIQEVADFRGDSFLLAQKAAQTDADVIVFCGVHFMGESAKILAPDKTVIIPDERAGCPMADMVNVEGLRQTESAASERQSRHLHQLFGGSESGDGYLLHVIQRGQSHSIGRCRRRSSGCRTKTSATTSPNLRTKK